MNRFLPLLLRPLILAAPVLALGGCNSCGFDCSNDSDTAASAFLTLGFSDSLPEELKKVVIKVESITFVRNNAADVKIDTFSTDDTGLNQSDFQVDLLEYRGISQFMVLEALELEADFYDSVDIEIAVGNVNDSYVKEDSEDSLKKILLAGTSTSLSVPGVELTAGTQTQTYVIEFGLAQALQLQADSGDYLLTTNGVRLENTLNAAQLSGTVEDTLFDAESSCSATTTPQAGNRLYLYKGRDLTVDNLADVFDEDDNPPAEAEAPFAVALLTKDDLTPDWRYGFGYIPAGDYTLAFARNTCEDDSFSFDDLTIPFPAIQLYEMTLTQGQVAVCAVTEAADAEC